MFHRIINGNFTDKILAIVVKDEMFYVERRGGNPTPQFPLSQKNIQSALTKFEGHLDPLAMAQLQKILSGVTYNKTRKVMVDNCTGDDLVAGVYPSSCSLDAITINNSYPKLKLKIKQTDLNLQIARVAEIFTMLPHIQYRDEVYSDQAILGLITPEFDCVNAYTFRLKAGCKPSAAINSIFAWQGPEALLLECMVASQIIYYKALLETIGAENFDKMFATSLILSPQTSTGHPLYNFLKFTAMTKFEPAKQPRPFIDNLHPGARVYFKNIDKFLAKHPSGHEQGINLFCLGRCNTEGEQLFGGMLPGHRACTYDETMLMLAAGYNSDPLPTRSPGASLSLGI